MPIDCRARRVSLTCATALVFAIAAGAQAGTIVENFNDGVADGFILHGMQGDPPNRVFAPPIVENGNLRLTDDVNSWAATALLPDLDNGAAIQSFTASFLLAIGPGSGVPADGLSFNFGQFIGGNQEFGEEGPGGFNGLTISADIYDNGQGEAPAIEVKVNESLIDGGRSTQNPYTNGAFVPVTVRFDADGTLDLNITGIGQIFTNLPTGFVPEPGDRFGWGARTGGLNAEHRIDDVNITTVVPEPAGLGAIGAGVLGLLARRRRA